MTKEEMNPVFYDVIIQKKLPAAAAPVKPIRYKVRKEVSVIKYISTPVIEEPELEPQSYGTRLTHSADITSVLPDVASVFTAKARHLRGFASSRIKSNNTTARVSTWNPAPVSTSPALQLAAANSLPSAGMLTSNSFLLRYTT
jgi:hypothetical protein